MCLVLYVHSPRRCHPHFTDGASEVSQLGSGVELLLNLVYVVPSLFPFLGNPTPDTGEGEESERLGDC